MYRRHTSSNSQKPAGIYNMRRLEMHLPDVRKEKKRDGERIQRAYILCQHTKQIKHEIAQIYIQLLQILFGIILFGWCRNDGALRQKATNGDINAADLRAGCQGRKLLAPAHITWQSHYRPSSHPYQRGVNTTTKARTVCRRRKTSNGALCK